MAVGVCTAVTGATVIGLMLAVARVSALLLRAGVVCRCLVWAPPGVGMGRMFALLGTSTGPGLAINDDVLILRAHFASLADSNEQINFVN